MSAQSATPVESTRADGVFEGGGVKGIAFAGAIKAAEEQMGVREWINVAGASAGAIVASLLVTGHGATSLRNVLDATDYRRFADYGCGGTLLGGLCNAVRRRGLARGDAFSSWLGDRLEESPEQGFARRDLPFGELKRDDLPGDLSGDEERTARYRLRVIASDITAGRMLVLPDDIGDYSRTKRGPNIRRDDLSVVEAVRMSMSFPYFFEPVRLWSDGREHLIIDGGLLSNFPVWLFDAPPGRPITRRTWGFRLHPGHGPDKRPYRSIRRLTWPVSMGRAMFLAATEAWDRRMSAASAVRTVDIPTGAVRTLDFNLSPHRREDLYLAGYDAATSFYQAQPEYMNSYGQRAAVTAPAPR